MKIFLLSIHRPRKVSHKAEVASYTGNYVGRFYVAYARMSVTMATVSWYFIGQSDFRVERERDGKITTQNVLTWLLFDQKGKKYYAFRYGPQKPCWRATILNVTVR